MKQFYQVIHKSSGLFKDCFLFMLGTLAVGEALLFFLLSNKVVEEFTPLGMALLVSIHIFLLSSLAMGILVETNIAVRHGISRKKALFGTLSIVLVTIFMMVAMVLVGVFADLGLAKVFQVTTIDFTMQDVQQILLDTVKISAVMFFGIIIIAGLTAWKNAFFGYGVVGGIAVGLAMVDDLSRMENDIGRWIASIIALLPPVGWTILGSAVLIACAGVAGWYLIHRDVDAIYG